MMIFMYSCGVICQVVRIQRILVQFLDEKQSFFPPFDLGFEYRVSAI